MTPRNLTEGEGDRVRDTGAQGSERERAGREGEGEVGSLPGVEKEGEEPKPVSSCHHPELSSASEPQLEQKYLSLLNLQLTP